MTISLSYHDSEITCCVADAIVVGILATADEKHNVKEDEWVRATGQLSKTTLDNREYPYFQIAELEKIAEPENPYIH